jgi:outer membrane protein OmpA-like peptidoglycan-associated protein
VRTFLLLLFTPLLSFTQQRDFSSCENALSLLPSGKYTVSFLGKKGLVAGNGVFQHAKNPGENQIWVDFTTSQKGSLNISFLHQNQAIQLLILKEKEVDLCSALKEPGLQVILERNVDSLVKLETELKVNENDHYFIVLLGAEKSKQTVFCQFSFLVDEEMKNKSWPLNLVYNESIPVYHLLIRDKVSLCPIEARIVLQGSNEINGIYRASDLDMNLLKKVKGGLLRVDAEGYLSADFENTAIPISAHFRDTIWLNPIKEGMLAELDDVYFAAGLATVLEESYPKLKRLRDFLILNPNVSIEVHGHVNEDNDKDVVSMKLSRKRAQKVVDYLVEGGISPKRLTAIGFGNTKPIYKTPQTEEEKEANRRVEILIRKN